MGTMHVRVDGVSLSTLNKMYDHPHTPWFASVVRHGTIYAQNHDHELPETRVWDYFREKYELAPHRFMHWHPHLARLLRGDLDVERPGCVGMPPPGPPVPPAAVPEPSPLLMVAMAIVGVAAFLGLRSALRGPESPSWDIGVPDVAFSETHDQDSID